MDDDDEKFFATLKHMIEHPEDRTPEMDRFVNEILLSPRYHQSLVDQLKSDTMPPERLDLLLSYARDPRPTEGRTFARRVLSEGWRVDDPVH